MNTGWLACALLDDGRPKASLKLVLAHEYVNHNQGCLDEKLPSYEVLKMRETRCPERIDAQRD